MEREGGNEVDEKEGRELCKFNWEGGALTWFWRQNSPRAHEILLLLLLIIIIIICLLVKFYACIFLEYKLVYKIIKFNLLFF